MARVLAEAKPTSAEMLQGAKDYATALRGKPQTHLECRAMRHAWRQRSAIRLINPKTRRDLPVIRIEFECERGCEVIRHDMLVVKKLRDNNFEVIDRLHPSYVYPEAYPIPGVPRGVRASTIIWQEFVRRQASSVLPAES